jgi:hypothetical protein
MRWLAVAVILGVCANARADELVRPEIDMITVAPLRTSDTGFVEQLLERARKQLIASYEANDEGHRARYNHDQARADAAEERERRLLAYANAHIDLAIALLERRRPRTVRALVLIGYAHRLARRELRGIDADRALVELCWRCREAADAHLRLGDHAFASAEDAAALAPAIEHFAAAAASDAASAEMRAYAEYKLAWCLHNQHDDAAALAHLQWAFGLAESAGTKGDRLAREAKRLLLKGF